MKYFLMETDPDCGKAPRITDWFNKIKKTDICLERHHVIEKRIVFMIKSDPETVFTGVITSPFLLLSEEVFMIVRQYDKIISKEMILVDAANQLTKRYYLPILRKVDCLSEQSKLSKDRTVLIHAAADRSKIKGDIFWIDGYEGTAPVISLDLAESILRREARGISLKPIELV